MEQDSSRRRTLGGRTSLVTTVAIVGVVLAGAAAVAANVGILSAADDSDLGELSAVTAAPQVVDVYVTDPTTAPSTTPTTAPSSASAERSQQFVVDVAGTATVVSTATGVRLADLSPSPGWTATPAAATTTVVTADFTDGTRVLSFRAELTASGDVAASVTDVTPLPPAASSSATASGGGGGGYEDDDDDDDEYEWESDEEHEGRDDDD